MLNMATSHEAHGAPPMICASVPLQHVFAHLDETLGEEDDEAPATIREEPHSFLFHTECGDPIDPVFLLLTLRPQA